MFYKKELLENMSQGARLKFIRENKGIKPNDIAKYLGYKSNKSIREWENNTKSPDATNLKRLPYYEISLDDDSYEKTGYNEIVQKAIREWQQMREKRQTLEISDEEYLEWKLNFEIES